jgi:hypothetical protein
MRELLCLPFTHIEKLYPGTYPVTVHICYGHDNMDSGLALLVHFIKLG